jgi:hypothetical protein
VSGSLSIFVHEGPGHWIGSTVVCLARTEEDAATIVRNYLDSHGLTKEAVAVRAVSDYGPGIVYAQDGDY